MKVYCWCEFVLKTSPKVDSCNESVVKAHTKVNLCNEMHTLEVKSGTCTSETCTCKLSFVLKHIH